MAGTIKHRFVSPVADENIATEVGPSEWNDSLVLAGGLDGDVVVRRTAQTDGLDLIKLGANPSWVNVTSVDNSLTGETDLHVYSIPAAHFNTDKRAIRLQAWGQVAANANLKTLRVRFGAAFVAVLNPTTTAPNGTKFEVEITVIRTAANAQLVFVKTLLGSAVELLSNTTGAETDANALTLKITGQSAVASADITLKGSMVEYLG